MIQQSSLLYLCLMPYRQYFSNHIEHGMFFISNTGNNGRTQTAFINQNQNCLKYSTKMYLQDYKPLSFERSHQEIITYSSK